MERRLVLVHERRERIIAPLDLVWDEIDSLDGARAAARFELTWGPLKWPLDVDVTMTLTAVGTSETRLDCRGHLETRHRLAAPLRSLCHDVVEHHVRTMVQRVKIRAEQRRLAGECLLRPAPG
jgi:hypothetical protein